MLKQVILNSLPRWHLKTTEQKANSLWPFPHKLRVEKPNALNNKEFDKYEFWLVVERARRLEHITDHILFFLCSF